MHLVFLDFDGVLNSMAWFRSKHMQTVTDQDQIDPAACGRVQELCDATNASIVISSTWRLMRKLPKLKALIQSKGLTAPVLGITPHIPKAERGEEIQRWLDRNEARGAAGQYDIEGLVILDDDENMLDLDPWLVRTTFEDGFTVDDLGVALDYITDPTPMKVGIRARPVKAAA